MTREEATALLKSRVDLIKSNYPEIDDYCESLEMAIEALKQEPCEDCISRQAVLDYLFRPYSNEELYSNIDIANFIKELPPVTPQQKIGKWEIDEDRVYTCNQCNKKNLWHSLYCPNCGAKMIEVQESEVIK